MASHQYSLRWNNYVTHVSTAFDSLRGDKDLVDVTLSCEGRKIPAHKMLLSACSSYFKGLFKENPCQHPVIIFRNVAYNDLMALVDFMYKGEVNVEQEQLASFLNTAELLEVQGLTNSGKDVDKSKKTVEEAKTAPTMEDKPEEEPPTPYQAPFNSHDESSQASPAPARKRRRTSPNRTEEESTPIISSVTSENPVIIPMEHVPLKTEAPDFEHIELNPEDSVDNTLNETDLAESGMEGGDMDNFAMAGPSHESMGEDKDGPNFSQPLPLPSTTRLEEMAGIEITSFTLAPPRPRIITVAKFARVQSNIAFNKSKMKRKFACKICNKRFYHKTACHNHVLTHIGSQPAAAESGEAPVRRNSYTTLMLSDVTPVALKDGETLSSRVIRRDGKFICSFCNRSFNFNEPCLNHIHVHLGHTTCQECGRVLSSVTGLRQHLQTHMR